MGRQITEKLTAIIDSPDQAQEAAGRLEAEGFAREDITVMSAEPLPAFISQIDSRRRGRAGLLAIGGGLAGAIAAIVLTVWTARRMGLVTGGMPIVTPWAFGIIVYELIALGAILTTFVATVYEAGLLRTRPPAPEVDSAVADGKVAVAVSCPNETSRRVAESVFSKFGAKIH
jgi:hypothetical protein